MAHTSRKPSAIRCAIGRLRAQGWSFSAIARELGIDRQTVTRNLSDPVTQTQMRKVKLELERPAAPPPPGASPAIPPANAPTPAGPQYKVPLEIVPLKTRRAMEWVYWEAKAGKVNPSINPIVLEAVEEWIHLGRPAPEPAPLQPERPPNRALEKFVERMNGPYGGGRIAFSVPVPRGAFDRRFR